jgi:hypothetical protein
MRLALYMSYRVVGNPPRTKVTQEQAHAHLRLLRSELTVNVSEHSSHGTIAGCAKTFWLTSFIGVEATICSLTTRCLSMHLMRFR